MKKQFDNNNFELYAPDSLKHVYKDLEMILNESLELYKKIFDVEDFRKVTINYFDNIDDFKNFIYNMRGEKDSLPSYAVGTYDKGMINAYIDPSINESDPLFNKRVHMASHELFHIMYEELVFNKIRMEKLTWFNEGCAQFFSGEKEKELNDDFNDWYNNVRSNTKKIPELNNLSHGLDFKTDDYNGYDLSLLAVKNIYDRLGFDNFKLLIKDSNRILRYGYNVINQAFLFYDIELGNNKTKGYN